MGEIVIFGGTLEGRRIAETFCDTPLHIHVCVATEYGASLLPESANIHIHTGRMDQEEIRHFLSSVSVNCCVDATHPYASEVTRNVSDVCGQLAIPYLRVYRREEAFQEADLPSGSRVIYRDCIEEAVDFLQGTTGNILITTGSKQLALFTALSDYRNRCFARVLPTAKVIASCSELGFEGKNLIGMQGPFDEELNYCILRQVHAKWLVTKSSGKEGGFLEKCDAAVRAGVHLVIIGRPKENVEHAMELSEVLDFLKRTYLSEEDRLNGRQTEHVKAHPVNLPAGEMEKQSETMSGHGKQSGTPTRRESGKRTLYLIGMGPGNSDLLTQKARKALAECDVIIGAARMLELCSDYADKPFYQSYQKEEILSFLVQQPQYGQAAIVYSGDIGFYSGAKGMRELIEHRKAPFELVPVCGIASPVYLLGRLGKPWEDVRLVSCHGQNRNLLPLIQSTHRVCALLGDRAKVSGICSQLAQLGLGTVTVTVGQRLTYEDEQIVTGTAEELCGMEFDPLSVALFENPHPVKKGAGFGIADEAFIRGKVPMTKEEVRVLSLSRLQLHEDSIVYDIGAGTGSVSVEAALRLTEGQVYAIEKKDEAVRLLYENQKKFHAGNLKIIQGEAPDCLDGLPAPTHAFVGGSTGRLKEIIRHLFGRNEKLRVVINAVTLETVAQLQQLIKSDASLKADVIQVQIARSREMGGYHLMQSENPVYIYVLEKTWNAPQ